jgi:phytoene dehydrogenase-like protein
MYRQWHEVFDIDRLTFVYPERWVSIDNERGECLDIYSDADRMERELRHYAPEDTPEIHRFATAVRHLGECPLPDAGDSWPHRYATGLRLVRYLLPLRKWSRVTSGEYGMRFSAPLLRSFFGEDDMAQLSALALVFTAAWMSKRNAGYPIGGSQAVIGLITERLLGLGGRLRLDTAVKTILVERDTAVGVQLDDGKRIGANWVISAADGHATIYDLLGGKYVDDTTSRIYRTLTPFPSWIQVSLGVALDLSQHCGYVTQVLDAPLTVDPGTALHQVSSRIFHFDPTFAPAGKTALTCVLPTRTVDFWVQLQQSDPARYEVEKRRVADAVIAVLEKRIPNLRGAIEVVDVSTPASVIRYTGNWKGSMEGCLLTPETGFRPLPQTLPGLRQFLMTGQWVMPGGGLPSGLITARRTVRQLCSHDGVPFAIGEARDAE